MILSEYKESAHVDQTIKMDNIFIILELSPLDKESTNPEYIKKEMREFQNYYERILYDIGTSEFHNLYLK